MVARVRAGSLRPVRLGTICGLAAALVALLIPVLPAAATPICKNPCTIWDPATQPTAQTYYDDYQWFGTLGVELGLQFSAAKDGMITGVRFYKTPLMSDAHTGHLWSGTGTLLASTTFTETGYGWQQANFSTPVNITANTPYWISVYASHSHYVATTYWAYPTTNSPLTAIGAAYAYSASSVFPNTPSLNRANYWVDAVYFKHCPNDQGDVATC